MSVSLDNGSAYAASVAGGHFDKAFSHFSACYLPQSVYAVFHSVNMDVCIILVIALHGAEYSAAGRKKPCPSAFLRVVLRFFKLDFFISKPLCKLFKGKHAVNYSGVILRLRLFRDTWPDKYGFRFGISLFYLQRVCLHG